MDTTAGIQPCPACATTNRPAARFCRRCGQGLEELSAAGARRGPAGQKTFVSWFLGTGPFWKKPVFVMPLAIGALALGGVAAFIVGKPMLRHSGMPQGQVHVVPLVLGSLPVSSAPVAVIPPVHVSTPSFECGLATTWAEQQVCSSDKLAEADRTVDRLYRHRFASAASEDRERLRQEQRDWIGRRNGCSAANGISCVSEAYEERIAELGASEASAAQVVQLPALAVPLQNQPPAARSHLILRPAWLRVPTPFELGQYYPQGARQAGLAGRALIQCMVAETGELNRCVVASETPEGFGFGASAIAMAGLFRMQSVDQDGQPIRGGVVRIPINFRTSSNLARRF